MKLQSLLVVLAMVSGLPELMGANSGLAATTEPHGCPRCDDLFTKLETTDEGIHMQDIQMQVRGEPKSGTTMMFEWARAALVRTCDFLELTYGHGTCQTTLDVHEGLQGVSMLFEPVLAEDDDSGCSCHQVDWVRISISQREKHTLPVSDECPWWHNDGIFRSIYGCKTVSGRPVQNHEDLWLCMQQTPCEVTDDRLQFVPIRDPRAVAVSSYYHMLEHTVQGRLQTYYKSVDDAVMRMLPELCQWIALRHILFGGLMAERSTLFWYEDAQENPLEWHYRWLSAVGLQLPASLVEFIAESSAMGAFRFVVVGRNPHPGGKAAEPDRTWKDEISPELLDDMDAIVRLWLPPVLLARLGIPS